MKILSVYDEEFAPYGKILEGYDVSGILTALKECTPLPEQVEYVAEDPNLQNCEAAKQLAPSLYGGLPVQFGYCNGHNTKLNCLEYHRDSEFNLGTEDFVLILGQEGDVKEGKLDTATCKAFRVPAGVLVEVYATSLHYAPCHADPAKGFKVLIGLPKGTNVGTTKTGGKAFEDKLLWAANKWLLAHPESSEAKDGAWVGLVGENLDIAADI
ncbi:MAG: DUF4867 family protein [Lachnospiraceae bacterium]|nr:DUF4867 family protein [Lachnospiraceae bacterium]